MPKGKNATTETNIEFPAMWRLFLEVPNSVFGCRSPNLAL